MKLIDQQSQEIDQKKRCRWCTRSRRSWKRSRAPHPVVADDYFNPWPHVKGLVVQNNVYNFGRMQEVWRDK